jgi:hypothetical protein
MEVAIQFPCAAGSRLDGQTLPAYINVGEFSHTNAKLAVDIALAILCRNRGRLWTRSEHVNGSGRLILQAVRSE